MTKITGLVPKTFQGKPSGFTVTFDDNRSGNLQEKDSDKGLRVGDEVVVTEIPYTSKAGKQSTLYGVRLVQQGSAQTPYKAPQNAPQQPPISHGERLPGTITSLEVFKAKARASIDAMGFVIGMVNADKIEFAQVKDKHKELMVYLSDSIDDTCQK